MSSATKDKVKGAAKEAKGKMKKAAGSVTNKPSLEAEGKLEELAGKAQRKVGDAKKILDRK